MSKQKKLPPNPPGLTTTAIDYSWPGLFGTPPAGRRSPGNSPRPGPPANPFAGTPLGGYWSPGLSALVDQLTQAAIGPQQNQLIRQQQLAQQNTLAQQKAVQEAYAAAAKLAGGVAPAIQQDYQGAAQTSAAFAKGYSDKMAELTNQSAGQANDLLAQNQSPQTISGDQGAADVLYGLGGSLPAQSLAQQGAGFTAAARQLPVTTSLQGAAQVAQIGGQGLQQQQEYGAQLSDLAGKVPGLRAQSLQDLIGLSLQAKAADVNAQYLGLAGKKQKFEQQASRRDYNLAVAKFKVDLAAARAQGQAPNASLSRAYGYIVDSYGNPILDAQGGQIPVVSGSAKNAQAKAAGKREDAVVSSMSAVDRWVQSQLDPGFVKQPVGNKPVVVGSWTDSNGDSKPLYAAQGGGTTKLASEAATTTVYDSVPVSRPTYARLLTETKSQLRTRLRRYGIKAGRIDTLAREIVNRYFAQITAVPGANTTPPPGSAAAIGHPGT